MCVWCATRKKKVVHKFNQWVTQSSREKKIRRLSINTFFVRKSNFIHKERRLKRTEKLWTKIIEFIFFWIKIWEWETYTRLLLLLSLWFVRCQTTPLFRNFFTLYFVSPHTHTRTHSPLSHVKKFMWIFFWCFFTSFVVFNSDFIDSKIQVNSFLCACVYVLLLLFKLLFDVTLLCVSLFINSIVSNLIIAI